MKLEKLDRENVSTKVAKKIRELIEVGELKPGDKLPSERQLADMLGVSRVAVREAIKTLQAHHVVEVKQGYGTIVKKADIEDIVSSLRNIVLLEFRALHELLELRRILEIESAGLAALRRDQDGIERLSSVFREMKECCKRGDASEFASLDAEFHLLIMKITGNRLVRDIGLAIRGLLVTSLEKILRETEGALEEALEGHEEIYQGILAQDPDRARKAMAEHLEKSHRRVLMIESCS